MTDFGALCAEPLAQEAYVAFVQICKGGSDDAGTYDADEALVRRALKRLDELESAALAQPEPEGCRNTAMNQQRFLRLPSGYLLDLSQVECVTPTLRDQTCRRFTVRFRSGLAVEIYENRCDMPACHIGREDFIRKLEAQ